MINEINDDSRLQRMLLDQFLDRFSFITNSRKNQKNKKANLPLLNPSKDESARLNLEKANKFIAANKHKKALKIINAALENGITSNQLLFKKAFLLSQNNQYEEAHAIWQALSKLKNKPKLAASAKESLETSQKIQLEALKNKKILIDNLYAKADQYQWKLKNIPLQEKFFLEANIAELVRKEAELARAAELPKLSIELIDQVLKYGPSSPWLNHDKALALNMMGKQEKALELLEYVQEEIKNPELSIMVQKSIAELKKPTNARQLNLKIYMSKQAKRFAIV